MDTFMSGYMMSESMFSVQTCMFKTTVSKYGHIQVWLYDVRESMFSRLQHILVPNMDTFMFGYTVWCQSPCSQSKHACSRLQHIPVPNMDTFVFGYMMSEPMFSVKTCIFKTAAYTGSKYGHFHVWLYDVTESMFSVKTCMFKTENSRGFDWNLCRYL